MPVVKSTPTINIFMNKILGFLFIFTVVIVVTGCSSTLHGGEWKILILCVFCFAALDEGDIALLKTYVSYSQ